MTPQEIKQKIIKELDKTLCLTVQEENLIDYIEYGWTFRFKQIKKWLFALLITETVDGQYKITFFGEREDWIEKFKSGHCSINTEFISSKNGKNKYGDEFDPWMDLICNVSTYLLGLCNHRKITEYVIHKEYAFYSFFSWLIDDIWYYNVKTPIRKWYQKHILPIIVKLIVNYWGLKYRKYLTVKRVYHNELYIYPILEIDLEYKENLSDEDYSIPYFSIEKSKLNTFLYKSGVEVNHIEYGKTRGFYLKNE